MSTAACGVMGEAVMVNNKRLNPEELKVLIEQVQSLRAVTKMTGVFTSYRSKALLEGLSTEDVVAVGDALQLKPRELPRKPEVKR